MSQYEEILGRLKADFEAECGCRVEDASDTGIKLKVLAEEFARLWEEAEYSRRQIFPDSAEGEYLARHGAMREVYKKEPVRATGKLTFKSLPSAPFDILIPKGTLCATVEGVLYRTTGSGMIGAGGTSISIPAEAVEAGTGGNTGSKTVTEQVTPIAGITLVRNDFSIKGGSDGETQERFRERVIESYSRISNGANLHYYEQFAKGMGAVWYAKARFVEGTPNQIELFVENDSRTLSEAEIAQVQEAIDKARELGIQVTVKKPEQKEIYIQALIEVDNLANRTEHALEAEAAIRKAMQEMEIGQRWSPAAVGSRVLEVPGIKDVTFQMPSGTLTLRDNEICTVGGITISSAW